MGVADPPPWDDLTAEALATALPGRPLRSFPALLSTDAEARAWARAGAPAGAVVVADYQVSPRGRAGLPWRVRQREGLGFSLVLRPDLPAEREGWLYVTVTSALADVVGPDATVTWPDEVWAGAQRAAAVGVHVELGPAAAEWAVVTGLLPRAEPPRGGLLGEVVAAIERRAADPADAVLDDYRPRCRTLDRAVRARMIPMGPAGPQVTGRGVDVLADGALVIQTERGTRVAVRPQNLGLLEDA